VYSGKLTKCSNFLLLLIS